jgi:Bacterial PH domain
MSRAEKHLAKITDGLQPGEQMLASVPATITDKPNSTSGSIGGALALTDQRLLFSGGTWAAKSSRSIPLDQVTSVDLHKTPMFAHIQITIAGGFERFLVKYKDATGFVAAAHEALGRIHAPGQSGAASRSVADEVAKLASLHAQGVLNDEEYSIAKARALS